MSGKPVHNGCLLTFMATQNACYIKCSFKLSDAQVIQKLPLPVGRANTNLKLIYYLQKKKKPLKHR